METLKTRLGQYAAAWLGLFLLALIVTLAGTMFLGMGLPRVADSILMVSLTVASVLLVSGLAVSLRGRDSIGTKAVLVVLAVVLTLPLLWAPVLGVVVAANFAHASIEYSGVYAWFRITVSNILYPLVSAIVSGAAIAWVWDMFQVFATIVGAIASAIQVWAFLRRIVTPTAAQAEVL
ncbi:MAG: hypothetical protein K1X35_11435 [Caulobacteraceae bacterium]|nr:hypothetical protein [Caulobacteraceae bacterium]